MEKPLRVCQDSAARVEQAARLWRRAANPPVAAAASCRRRRAGSPFHPFWRITFAGSWLTAACSAWAFTVPVVIPASSANVEGNTNMSDFLNSSSFRMQLVFDALQFVGLGAGPGISNAIGTIGFRIAGASTNTVLYAFAGASIAFSTTPRGPDRWSPICADHVGLDAVTIYNGALPFGAAHQLGATPQPHAPYASMPAHEHTGLRSPYTLSMRLTGGQNLCSHSQRAG